MARRVLADFQRANFLAGAVRLLQGALAVLLVGQVLFLAARFHLRADLTRDQLYALSPESRAYLRGLEENVRIYSLLTPGWPEPDAPEAPSEETVDYVHRLLDEYVAAARRPAGDRLSLERVDLFRRLSRAREIERQFRLTDPNAVVLAGPERIMVLKAEDFVETARGEVERYVGENALTSAILQVTSVQPAKVYFTVGHGEMEVESSASDRGLSQLAIELRQRNFAVETLDLTAVERVPPDAGLVLVAGPAGPFLPVEQERLREFLGERSGRVGLYLDPGVDHGLQQLLAEWGVETPDMVVIEAGEEFQSATRDLLIRRLTDRPHPVTAFIGERGVPIVATACRPVLPAADGAADPRLAVGALLFSSPTSWGERNWRQPEGLPMPDRGTDLAGPVALATVAERRVQDRLGINLSGGRLAVFGNADLLGNARIVNTGNRVLLTNTVNWLASRDQGLNLPARPARKVLLPLSEQELNTLALWLVLPPGAIALLGLAVGWWRRR